MVHAKTEDWPNCCWWLLFVEKTLMNLLTKRSLVTQAVLSGHAHTSKPCCTQVHFPSKVRNFWLVWVQQKRCTWAMFSGRISVCWWRNLCLRNQGLQPGTEQLAQCECRTLKSWEKFSNLSQMKIIWTHFLLSNAFTVVSQANELTRFTISARMQGRRNWAAMSAVHCWMDGQPVQRTKVNHWHQVGLSSDKGFY